MLFQVYGVKFWKTWIEYAKMEISMLVIESWFAYWLGNISAIFVCLVPDQPLF